MKRFLLLSTISVLGLTSAWTIWQNQFVRFTPASIEALAAMPAGQVLWHDMEFWIQRKNRPTP